MIIKNLKIQFVIICFFILSYTNTAFSSTFINDSIKIEGFFKKANLIKYVSTDSALYYCNSAFDIIKTNVELENILVTCDTSSNNRYFIFAAQYYELTADLYLKESNMPGAFVNYSISLELYKCLLDNNKQSKIYSKLGNLYLDVKNYKVASLYFKDAVNVIKDSEVDYNKNKLLSYYLNELAFSLMKEDSLSKSIECYNRSLNYLKKDSTITKSKKHDIANVYYKIADVFFIDKNYKQAEKYYKDALSIYNDIEYIGNEIEALLKIGETVFLRCTCDSALLYYVKAENLTKDVNDLILESKVNNSMSEYYLYENNSKLAITYANKNIELTNGINDISINVRTYNNLYQAYLAEGNQAKALKYMKLYSYTNDSLLKTESNNQILLLANRLSIQQKEQEIELINRISQIQNSKIKQSRILNIFLIVLILLSVILVVVVIRSIRIKNKNKQLIMKQKVLSLQMNPHFIFNALTAIEKYMYTHNDKDSGKYLTKFSKLMRSVLISTRQDFISLDEELELIESYLKIQQLRFDNKFEFVINLDEKIETEFIEIPPMLIQPFIENAIEHGFSDIEHGGLITINISLENGFIRYEIIDNGKGTNSNKNELDKDRGQHLKVSTSIIKERLRILNKGISHKSFSISSGNDAVGTKIVVLIKRN